MKTIRAQITIDNDPSTLGDGATRADLEAYGAQLVAELSEEFGCDCYLSLQSCLRSSVTCSDDDLQHRITERLHQITSGDEWIQVLRRSTAEAV